MDGLIPLAVVVAVVAPLVLAIWLRRTPVFWLPAIPPVVLGLVAFGSITEIHGDVGGVGALANGVMWLGGMCLLGYGALCLAVGTYGYRRARQQRPAPPQLPAELPPVTVVKDPARR
jgi:hypothetical protein